MSIHAERDSAVKHVNDESSEHTRAGELNYDSIGSRVEFYWNFPNSEVLAHVAGELRQVHHDGNHTTVSVTGWPERGPDIEDFTLDHEAPIYVVVL